MFFYVTHTYKTKFIILGLFNWLRIIIDLLMFLKSGRYVYSLRCISELVLKSELAYGTAFLMCILFRRGPTLVISCKMFTNNWLLRRFIYVLTNYWVWERLFIIINIRSLWIFFFKNKLLLYYYLIVSIWNWLNRWAVAL